MGELVGPLLFAVLVVGVLLAAELLRKATPAPREITRKFAHCMCGLSLLAMPAFVDSHWEVLGLAAGFAGLMMATDRLGVLTSIHGVGRGVSGVVVYPAAGWLAYFVGFEVANDNWFLFSAPILVLAFADTAAALVGQRFGRHRFCLGWAEPKSIEGSAACFATAFASVLLAATLTAGPAGIELLALALIAAELATIAEAASPRGGDNLTVPASVSAALLAGTGAPPLVLVAASVAVAAAAMAVAVGRQQQGMRPAQTAAEPVGDA